MVDGHPAGGPAPVLRGPLIAGWIVSTGFVVAFGAWWMGIGHWILGGMVAMLLMGGGALAWLRRQRARSNKDCS